MKHHCSWLLLMAGWSCAPAAVATPPCPPPALIVPAPVAPAPASAASEREKIAVMPIEDEKLFRAERAMLRQALHATLARLLPQHDLLPLATVDDAIAPTSKTAGRCAALRVDVEARARRYPWALSELTHLMGSPSQPAQLWVDLARRGTSVARLEGVWNENLDLMGRYQQAFAALQPHTDVAIAGLALSDVLTIAAPDGAAICEWSRFRCEAPNAFDDAQPAVAACFAGAAADEQRLVIERRREGDACEIANLDELEGPLAKREACLCAAVRRSKGMAARAGRRVLRLRFLAPELRGRPQPELRVIEASPAVETRLDFHTPTQPGAKTRGASVRRLDVDQLDTLRAPLAACDAAPGTTVISELTLAANGSVTAATAETQAPLAACIQRALGTGAFDCPNGHGTAKLRIAITWPPSP